jgi:hypothetical protein
MIVGGGELSGSTAYSHSSWSLTARRMCSVPLVVLAAARRRAIHVRSLSEIQ